MAASNSKAPKAAAKAAPKAAEKVIEKVVEKIDVILPLVDKKRG